ncbi:FAD-dependent oxidoreductase, partial [Selenomonas sp.]
MEKATVVVIGGGATGVGILRDLAMRGVDVMLVEKRDLINGASSRYHGLLHSGGRYAVKDQEAAKECIEENTILRKIGKSCVEASGGMFVRLDSDDPDYEQAWVEGCKVSGIEAKHIDLDEAFRLEPRLSKHVVSAYLVPDAAIDGFRMSWQNVDSAKRYGGRLKTYTEVIGILKDGDEVHGIKVRDAFSGEEYEIGCDILINAGGGWAGKIAEMAGLEVGVQPDKGTLLAFNQRIANHVVNRLHKSSDGDIFVPHGSITILGTTSMSIPDAEDTSTSREEVEKLLSIGEQTFEHLRDYRLLRCFAG